MSDGTQSPVLGYQKSEERDCRVTTREIPANKKIAKVRASFCFKSLTRIELLDSESLIGNAKTVIRNDFASLEATIPANERLIGFKVKNDSATISGIALVTAKSC